MAVVTSRANKHILLNDHDLSNELMFAAVSSQLFTPFYLYINCFFFRFLIHCCYCFSFKAPVQLALGRLRSQALKQVLLGQRFHSQVCLDSFQYKGLAQSVDRQIDRLIDRQRFIYPRSIHQPNNYNSNKKTL